MLAKKVLCFGLLFAFGCAAQSNALSPRETGNIRDLRLPVHLVHARAASSDESRENIPATCDAADVVIAAHIFDTQVRRQFEGINTDLYGMRDAIAALKPEGENGACTGVLPLRRALTDLRLRMQEAEAELSLPRLVCHVAVPRRLLSCLKADYNRAIRAANNTSCTNAAFSEDMTFSDQEALCLLDSYPRIFATMISE